MKTKDSVSFYQKEHNRQAAFPLDCQMELTYRCNLRCVHCYCQGLGDKEKELTTHEFKKILNDIHRQGCLWLALTGGEPLIREDFLELYAYAKQKGFIILIFSNGQLFNKKIIDYLVKSPPYSVEITLNGITQGTYERITQVEGSFARVMENIRLLSEKNIPVLIKSNLFKYNKDEFIKIKQWVGNFFGESMLKHHYKYDHFVSPRLNGDTTPTQYRLSYAEIVDVLKKDLDLWKEYQEEMTKTFPESGREPQHLYHCDSWKSQFFINPFGRFKFCLFSEKFSFDLRQASLKEAFPKMRSQVSDERIKSSIQCGDCHLRLICHSCPSRAYLETKREETPVPYYCEFAKAMEKDFRIKPQ